MAKKFFFGNEFHLTLPQTGGKCQIFFKGILFRQAKKVPHLNATSINETTKEFLLRNNSAFTAFKTIRGTAMYYEDVKKRLMAFIRQKGPPTLFNTFSSAEFDWNELVLKIYETKMKKKYSIEFIEKQTSAWKNKIISENVVQSTLHFAKRTDKLMSYLSKIPIFEHEGVKYSVSSYFYRVEFQARGAPHLHCMFWLEGENGELPPKLYDDNDVDANASSISQFAQSCISGSHKDIACSSCSSTPCDNCSSLQNLVKHYQTHSHKTTCLKKNKVVHIKSKEGHGKFDGLTEGDDLQIKTCRFDFPKNPLDETLFLPSLPLDIDPKDFKKIREDYSRIRKYLFRITNGDNFRDEDKWKLFKELSFFEFLEEVGMFEPGQDILDEECQRKAKSRYLTALKCEAKSGGILVLRRNTADIMTNNFNKGSG